MILSFTVNTSEHVPYLFCFYIKCSFHETLSQQVHYLSSNAAEEFCKSIEERIIHEYSEYMNVYKEMNDQ